MTSIMKNMLYYVVALLLTPFLLFFGVLSHVLCRMDRRTITVMTLAALLTISSIDILYFGNFREHKDGYLVLISTFALQTLFSSALNLSHQINLGLASAAFAISLYLLVASERGNENPLLVYACALVMTSSVVYPVIENGWWLPVSDFKLKESEDVLLQLWCPNCAVELHVIAGLGTYVVSDDKKKKTSSYQGGASHRRGRVPLVLVHGYGAGNGYWALNIEGLTAAGFQVYCVELPGFGRSDRPAWVSPASTEEALGRLSSSLESWREAMGLERFVLLGHSLGTHAVSAYAMEHPKRIMHLLLASPVGVGLPPTRLRKYLSSVALKSAENVGVNLDMGIDDSTVPNECPQDDKEETAKLLSPAAQVQATLSKPSHEQPWTFRMMMIFFSWYWTNELTPFDITRLLGPFGPHITAWAFRKRINRSAKGSYMRKLSDEQVSALDRYSYQNHAAPASGERILNSILMPGAYARYPLLLWLRNGNGNGQGEARIHFPVTFLYGSLGVDWMESKFGFELCRKLCEESVDAICVEMENQVGHLNYLEDPAQFVRIVEEQVLVRKRIYQPKK